MIFWGITNYAKFEVYLIVYICHVSMIAWALFHFLGAIECFGGAKRPEQRTDVEV